MTSLARTLGFSIVVALASATIARAAAPCQLQELGSLAMKMDDGVPTVDAEINGKPARMIIATAASGTDIFQQAAVEYGATPLTSQGTSAFGVSAPVYFGLAKLKSFKIAGVAANDYEILVVRAGKYAATQAQGYVGENFLRHWDMEFDFAHDKVRFFKPLNCVGDQVVYWGSAYSAAHILDSPNRDITVQVKLNGAPFRATISTGSSASTVRREVADKLRVRVEPERAKSEAKAKGDSDEPAKFAVFDTFSFGDEIVKKANLRVARFVIKSVITPVETRTNRDIIELPDMYLGTDFLRYHRIYVSRDQHMMYISYTGGPVFHHEQSEGSAPAPAAPPAKAIPGPAG